MDIGLLGALEVLIGANTDALERKAIGRNNGGGGVPLSFISSTPPILMRPETGVLADVDCLDGVSRDMVDSAGVDRPDGAGVEARDVLGVSCMPVGS